VAFTGLFVGLFEGLFGGGCYRHVVAAKGPGAENYRLYEPASKSMVLPKLDNWVMGDPNKPKKSKKN